MQKNTSLYLKDDQKNLAVFCKGDGCTMRDQCLRYVSTNKIFRVPSENCIALGFDLYLARLKKEED